MNLKTILVIVAVVLAGFSICLFLGYLEVYPFTVLWEETGKFVSGLNFDFSNPSTLITTGIGAAGTAVAVGAPLLSKLNSVKQQVEDTAASAKSQIGSITSELEGKTEQLKTTELDLSTANTKIAELTKQAEDYKSQLEGPTGQVSKLQAQMQCLTDQNSSFVKSLMSAANGALVTNPIDGKIYSVLKVPPEVHVK